MFVTVNRKIEDKQIDEQLRSYGVRKAARAVSVPPSYLSHALNKQSPISEKTYKALSELFYQ